jgi:hypothetical protein
VWQRRIAGSARIETPKGRIALRRRYTAGDEGERAFAKRV